jgi:hypothetical protein
MQSFSYKLALTSHKKKVHDIDDGPLLKCDASDCQYSTHYRNLFKSHRATKHGLGDGIIACTFAGCSFVADISSLLRAHMVKHMTNEERELTIVKQKHKCIVDGCSYASSKKSVLTNHTASVHNIDKHKVREDCVCTEAGCDFVALRVTALNRHRLQVHGDQQLYIHCDVAGCSYKSIFDSSVRRHNKLTHNIDVVFHACSMDDCDFKSKHAESTRKHEARKHRQGGKEE